MRGDERLLRSKAPDDWATLVLVTAVATSVTGFMCTKVPVLRAAALTLAALPFALIQAVTLVAFAVIAIAATRAWTPRNRGVHYNDRQNT